MSAVIPGRFTGRTAIITGAASGIGRAVALRLAREGARVVAGDLSSERLDEMVAEFPDLMLVPVAGNVTEQQSVQALVAAAQGRVDVLINNAGIMDGFLPAGEIDDDTWSLVFDVNVTAAMRTTRAVLPLMIAAGGGSIVNLASEAALRGSAAGVAYTASKHAVVGLTKSTAVLYRGQGVRANAVAPGPTATAIEAPFRSAHAATVLGPMMKAMLTAPVQPQEMAASIAWLASDDASNVNGVLLASDGGWSAI